MKSKGGIMNERKTKRINVRVSLKDYRILNRYYLLNKERYKNFSDYIRHLLELGLDESVFYNYH